MFIYLFLVVSALSCKTPCLTCVADTTQNCLTCHSDYYLLNINDTSQCVKKCPHKYYIKNGTCTMTSATKIGNSDEFKYEKQYYIMVIIFFLIVIIILMIICCIGKCIRGEEKVKVVKKKKVVEKKKVTKEIAYFNQLPKVLVNSGKYGLLYKINRNRKEKRVNYAIKVLNCQLTNSQMKKIYEQQQFYKSCDSTYYTNVVSGQGNTLLIRSWQQYNLIEYLQDHKLSASKMIDFAVQITNQLTYIHQNKFCHGNFNINNILVNTNDPNNVKVKISDACIEFRAKGKFSRQQLYYISPEYIQNQKNAEQYQEIWTLGVIIYYISMQQFPFKNIQDIVNQDYIEVSQGVPNQIKIALTLIFVESLKERASLIEILNTLNNANIKDF